MDMKNKKAGDILLDIRDTVHKIEDAIINKKEVNININKQEKTNKESVNQKNKALEYVRTHPVLELTPRQLYLMHRANYDMSYIKMISGLSDDELKKKLKSHIDKNV